MNIESILSKINLFEDLVVKSGFTRDINDYIQAIQKPENQNLVFMKGLSEKVQASFIHFENNSLPSELKYVVKDSQPFTSKNFYQELQELDANQDIDGNGYFQKLNNVLNDLNSSIEANRNEIKAIRKTFSKYVTEKAEFEREEDQALVSLVFKDLQSTSTLKEFEKVLKRWDTTLLLLHQLLKSESPEDISLVEIQNGSIDVILNIDFDVAIDLTDIINTGLKVYAAYLIYKSKLARATIESFLGNQELIELENKKDRLMLSNIKTSVEGRIKELHEERLQEDPAINKTSIDKKVEEVSSVITDHIIKGNEVKLLTPPKPKEGEDTEEESSQPDLSQELRENTALVREQYKELSQEEQTLLLETYAIRDDEE